jgi:hypothetical protein
MHVGDLGGLIWILIVVIAVISSIRRNIARVRSAQQQPRASQAPPPPVAAPAPQMPQSVAQAFAMPPVVPPPVAPPPAPAPPPVAFPAPARLGTSTIRGMFGGSTTLVRAIVAAEVLGPPIALQERTIWSPRHSEPSI